MLLELISPHCQRTSAPPPVRRCCADRLSTGQVGGGLLHFGLKWIVSTRMHNTLKMNLHIQGQLVTGFQWLERIVYTMYRSSVHCADRWRATALTLWLEMGFYFNLASHFNTWMHIAHTQDQSAHLVSVGHWKGLFNVYTVCLWLQAGGGQQFLHFCLKWVISTCLDISTQMHTLKYQSVIGKDCFNTMCSLLVTTFDGMLQSPVCKLWPCYVIWVTPCGDKNQTLATLTDLWSVRCEKERICKGRMLVAKTQWGSENS